MAVQMLKCPTDGKRMEDHFNTLIHHRMSYDLCQFKTLKKINCLFDLLYIILHRGA